MKLDNANRHASEPLNFFRPSWMGEAPSEGCSRSARGGKSRKNCLSREGNVIKTERYDITVTKDKVSIRDRSTGESVEAWGDPHLWTGDGDKFMFTQDNLTIDLPDGTKVTIEPTEVEGSVSWVEKLHVMAGDNAISVEGIHTGAEPVFGELGFNAADVDAAVEDGIVLYAERSIDDLFSRQSGEELISQEFERLLDGMRGQSQSELFNRSFESVVEPTLRSTEGMDVYTRLFIIMGQLNKSLEESVNELEKIGQMRTKKNNLSRVDQRLTEVGDELSNIEQRLTDPNVPETVKTELRSRKATLEGQKSELSAEFDSLGGKQALDELSHRDFDTELQRLQFEIQQLTQMMQQFSQMMTNLSKNDHDAKMATVRNLRS